MSFPSHDSYWVEVANFLDTHTNENDDILAPKEFEYRLVNCFPYRVAQTIPVKGFQWMVIHKGQLDRLAIPFLLDAVKQLQPVYANPVFVVLCRHGHLPRLQDSNDLVDFNQRLMAIVQSGGSTGTVSTDGGSSNATTSIDPASQSPELQNTDLKISIVTICRNAADTIEATIKAIAAQTYPNIEYIVVDGASDDGTLEVCDRHSSTITTLVSEPDDGIYNAMNKGVSLATGDFIYFANADDYLFAPDVVENVVAFIQANPDSDVVYGSHEARFPGTGVPSSIHTPTSPDQMLDAIVCFKGGCLLQPATFFRRTLFNQVGLFSEDYGIASDYKWFLDALQHSAVTFSYCPHTVVSYAHGGRSGDIRPLFEEIFDIQAKSALCQQPEWVEKRAIALQQDFINKYSELQKLKVLAEQRDRHLIQIKQRNI
ncbi:MAG: glycosyltransferase family 2 protein [Cyanobacteria bacterium P01_F01_bin.150]